MASLLELIDTTIVNVALPQIMGNLGATLEDAGWLVTGYAVANVIVLPMSGWLGDRFGRKNYFLASILIFTVASYLCGQAGTLTELILFRDRKSTRLNSSHSQISYAVFCLKKKKKTCLNL